MRLLQRSVLPIKLMLVLNIKFNVIKISAIINNTYL